GMMGYADGSGSAARFTSPTGVAVDASGNVYVTDLGNETLRKITPAGMVSTLAGSAGVPGSTDGAGRDARFYHPFGVAVESSGNVYVADTYNSTIRRVTASGVVTTLAGSARMVGSADGTGNVARFNAPRGVGTDDSGNLYVADTDNHLLRKVTAAGVVTTIVGSIGSIGAMPGPLPASLYFPQGIALTASGDALVTTAQGVVQITAF
ncbi:MAG TPA: hypothetical protein VFV14_09400, partial [Myxococcaceae bacterium]|nr:hypothetical protein [Myxococcaceae bacterium]